jgi:hypothetical protein
MAQGTGTLTGAPLATAVLDLLATPPEGLDALSAADWSALDLVAARHRLQPLLHVRYRADARVPAALRECWAATHRQTALTSLSIRADLADAVALLRSAGIEPLALKGAWLAWHAYAHPAERPLRDIDLLVPFDQGSHALDILLAAGWPLAEEPDLPIAQLLAVDKSPPPVIAPRGTPIELHWRAWFPAGRLDHFSPQPDDAGMFARAITAADGLRYPGPADMLAHLIIHGAYSHRFDCGPLLLTDIAALLKAAPIDWAGFWTRAEREGWGSGARIVLDLVTRIWPAAPIDWTGAPGRTPPPLLTAATELLVQDTATRLSAGVAAGGWSGLLRRLRREVGTADGQSVRRSSARDGGYLAWAGSRLRRTLGELTNPAVRHQASNMARLNRWLDR